MSAPEPVQGTPALRFVVGNPTPEEVAAVTAVLLARETGSGSSAAGSPGRRDQFRRMRLGLRLRPGRGAWRRSKPEE
ncbi:acyl-CoA carboxylase subunit epsilon [Kocuria sediminis]|uniref:Acyl-CoA carboxylase subunit epsilon n=1 Tax=Kocuria sediminis TaxID=1038857 RepID=A0A6N8GKQ5_9MICC|nr:acyl-CoA carboxylase subunit epsilon [Kocuria sediminis]